VPLAIATGVVAVALVGVLAWAFLSGQVGEVAGGGDAEPASVEKLAFLPEADDGGELPEVSTPAPRQAAPSAAGTNRASTPAAPTDPLPALDASDALVRSAVAGLSSRPELVVWLANDDLIRRFVAAVDNVAEGRSPRTHIVFLEPDGDFLVVGEGPTLRVDPSAERRYDTLATVVSSLDVDGTVRAYNRLEPLFESAYRDLGHPEGGFGVRLTEAIAQLLATPVVSGAPGLTRHVFSYRYGDPELEELSDAQKHLLRMGPRNVKRVQAKLREFAGAVGIASDALPRPKRYVALPAGG
jgi:hypothetical protein